MKKTLTRNLCNKDIPIINNNYISLTDYKKILADTATYLDITTIKDANEANTEIKEHLEDAFILLKSIKDAIPESGSGIAKNLALTLLTDLKKLEKELDDFAKNRFFKRPEKEKLSKIPSHH